MRADRLDAAALQFGNLPQAHAVEQKGQHISLAASQLPSGHLICANRGGQKSPYLWAQHSLPKQDPIKNSATSGKASSLATMLTLG